MKHLKLFGLTALLAASIAIAAASASATSLTGAGGAALGAGTVVALQAQTNLVMHPPFGATECNKSNWSGKTSNSGGAAETVKVSMEAITFSECNMTMTVLANGSLEFHTQGATANNNATLTSNGFELTTEYFGTHCIFKTSNTDIGTVTGSANTGGNAVLDISATMPRTGGRSGAFCGSTAQWTGSFKFTSPSTLDVD